MAAILNTNHHLGLKATVFGENGYGSIFRWKWAWENLLQWALLERLISINISGSSRHYYIIRSVVKNLSSMFSNIKLLLC